MGPSPQHIRQQTVGSLILAGLLGVLALAQVTFWDVRGVSGISLFALWYLGAAFIHLLSTLRLPAWTQRLAWWALLVATGLFAFWLLRGPTLPEAEASPGAWLLIVLWLVMAAAAFIHLRTLQATGSGDRTAALSTLTGYAFLAIAFALLNALALSALLVYPGPWSIWAHWIILGLTGFLAAESLLRFFFGFYQPLSQRSGSKNPLTSAVFQSLLGGRQTVRVTFEELTGTRLEDVWMLRFASRAVIPSLGSALLLFWASTSITLVPLGYEGIRIHMGRFFAEPLGSGPHLHLPWPLGRIEKIETSRIRQVGVGFQSDLLGPVLWNEKHLEGEEDLLIGDGDEILTVNMPVFFRIKDARAFLLNTAQPEETVTSLAQRELIRAIAGETLFNLISVAREQTAQTVHEGLQREMDRLETGIEIVFVGLKDMHPPVQIAEAYQAVASAEEERETFIERSRAFRQERLAEAAQNSFRTRQMADRTARERVLEAEAETAGFAFLSLADLEDEHSILRFRLWSAALDRLLPGKDKLILPPGEAAPLYLDFRSQRDIPLRR